MKKITFYGDSAFCDDGRYKGEMLAMLEDKIGNEQATFYLGGYGGFDRFAYGLANEYKRLHPSAKIVLVTPHPGEKYKKGHFEDHKHMYDEILYPSFSAKDYTVIMERDRFLVDHADIVFAYITTKAGGAYDTFAYAQRHGKDVYNLANKKSGF